MATRCDHVSVGAGPAGVYFAWRLALDPATSNASVCLVERLERAGGRVASMVGAGPFGDLVVEPGAYRFAPEKFCMHLGAKRFCLWTPIVASVIENALNLKSKRYNPNQTEFDYNLYKIIDEHGEDAGFAQYVWGMLREISRAAFDGKVNLHTFFQHSLQEVELPSENASAGTSGRPPVTLHLQDVEGRRASITASSSVLLNLPQQPLLHVLARSPASRPPIQLQNPNPAAYMKLYLHYKDAWWRGGRYAGLDLRSGQFSNVNLVSKPIIPGMDVMHDFPGVQSPAPLHGAYHDGDVRCTDTSGLQRCRGYIQAHYSDDMFALMFYRSFGLLSDGNPITNVTRHSHGAAGQWLLDEVHGALVQLHAQLLGPEAAEDILKGSDTQPDHAVLSIWDAAAQGFGAACHFSRLGRSGGSSASEALEVARRVLRPFRSSGEDRVFVASEAYAPLQCWSEGALQMAENALHRLGVHRPAWMPQSVYSEIIFADPGEVNEQEGFSARHSMPPQLGLVGSPSLISSGSETMPVYA